MNIFDTTRSSETYCSRTRDRGLYDNTSKSSNTDIVYRTINTNTTDKDHSRKIRVVGSLTTMHDRYPKLEKTLKTLQSQTYPMDAIYLGLPKVSRRLGVEYPPLPEEILDLCTVVPCIDYGPITKILGALLSETDPEAVIITFDDDMNYPPNLVEELMEKHRQFPDSALGSSGMLLRYPCPMCSVHPNENNALYRISKVNIPVEGRRVDSIYGYPGALYVRKFFPEKYRLEEDFLKYSLMNHENLMNDDILISGFLSLKNIERRIFDNMPEVGFTLLDGELIRVQKDNEISYNLDIFFQRMNSAISNCKQLGMYQNTEPVDMSETIFGIVFIVIICILIIIGLCIYFLWR